MPTPGRPSTVRAHPRSGAHLRAAAEPGRRLTAVAAINTGTIVVYGLGEMGFDARAVTSLLLWLAVWFGLPVAALLAGRATRRRLRELERHDARRNEALARIEGRLQELERLLRPRHDDTASAAPPVHTSVEVPATAPAPRAERIPAAPAIPPPPVVPPAPRAPSASAAPPPPVGPPLTIEAHEAPALPHVDEAPSPAAAAPPPPATPAAESAGPPPPGPRPRIERQPPSRPSPVRIDWEGLVGVKLFSWIAGIALVFAAVFFLRHSIEHGWLGPAVRMALGLAVGTGLLIACEARAAQRYPVTANALDAAGIAILFSTLFASHALWNLLPQLPVFLLMALVTAVAVLLSIRRDSIFIALLGLLGGFATPALLSTGQDRPIGLFGYLLLLNAGLAWLAHRKRWSLLTALSVAFTAFYQWAWVLEFLDASRLPLAMGIFLVFPILHLVAVWLAQRSREAQPPATVFEQTATAAAVLPLLLAVYLAAVPAYGAHYALLFTFLLLVTAGLTIIAVTRGPQTLHAVGATSALVAFAVWFGSSYDHGAWPGVLIFVAVFVLFHLAAPLIARRLGQPFAGDVELATLTAPLLLFAFPLLAAIEPATAAPGVLFGVLFFLLSAIAATAVATEAGRLHFLAACFALAAEAVWSAKHLTPERLLPALTIYAGFGLSYLGVPIAAERWGKRLEPEGSGALLLFLSLGLLFFLATGPMAHTALWGLALLLAMVNLGLFAEASRARLPGLTLAGAVLSWIILGVWWANTLVASLLLPSLTIVAGFALLLLAGNLWAQRQAARAGAPAHAVPVLQRGLLLGLAGHLFLLFVASQASLAVPPWPLFAVLGLLDLTIGAAALYARRARLHLLALGASQLILGVWIMVAEATPWPLVGMLASAAVVAFALLWVPLSRRRAAGDGFVSAAVVTIFLAQLVVFTASGQPIPPALHWIGLEHVILLMALLALAATTPWHELAVWAVVPTALQGTAWLLAYLSPETWSRDLLFVASPYAVFLAYPLLLGQRAGRAQAPYLSAVIASVVFFVLARHCLITGGWGHVIGILPVIQAGLLLALLARLLGIEPPGARHAGRLALVAGAALAFITVAIPLQLERQWITIGWALEAAALAWLYRRIPHRGVLAWSAGLGLAVFVRLCLNPAVLDYHPRGALPIWNWYLYTYLISALALLAAARWLRATDDRTGGPVRVSDGFAAGGTVLLFLLLNIEIADLYSTGRTLTFNFSADLAQDLTYTLGWALFAIGLLTFGISRVSRAARIAALALLVVTVVKCFLHDLWRLGGLYRVGSFVGLAVCLALVAVLLQRFVLGGQREELA